MLTEYNSHLLIEISSSRKLSVLLIAVHVLALICTGIMPVNTIVQLILALIIIYSFYFYRKNLNKFTKIVMKYDDEWELFYADGKVMESEMTHYKVLWNTAVLFYFKIENCDGLPTTKFSVLLCDDAVESDVFSYMLSMIKTNRLLPITDQDM